MKNRISPLKLKYLDKFKSITSPQAVRNELKKPIQNFIKKSICLQFGFKKLDTALEEKIEIRRKSKNSKIKTILEILLISILKKVGGVINEYRYRYERIFS